MKLYSYKPDGRLCPIESYLVKQFILGVQDYLLTQTGDSGSSFIDDVRRGIYETFKFQTTVELFNLDGRNTDIHGYGTIKIHLVDEVIIIDFILKDGRFNFGE